MSYYLHEDGSKTIDGVYYPADASTQGMGTGAGGGSGPPPSGPGVGTAGPSSKEEARYKDIETKYKQMGKFAPTIDTSKWNVGEGLAKGSPYQEFFDYWRSKGINFQSPEWKAAQDRALQARNQQQWALGQQQRYALGQDSVVQQQSAAAADRLRKQGMAALAGGRADPLRQRQAMAAQANALGELGAQQAVGMAQERQNALQAYLAGATGLRTTDLAQLQREQVQDQAMRDWQLAAEKQGESWWQRGVGEKYADAAMKQEAEKLEYAKQLQLLDKAWATQYGQKTGGAGSGGIDAGGVITGIASILGPLLMAMSSEKEKTKIEPAGSALDRYLDSGNVVASPGPLKQNIMSANSALSRYLDAGQIRRTPDEAFSTPQEGQPKNPWAPRPGTVGNYNILNEGYQKTPWDLYKRWKDSLYKAPTQTSAPSTPSDPRAPGGWDAGFIDYAPTVSDKSSLDPRTGRLPTGWMQGEPSGDRVVGYDKPTSLANQTRDKFITVSPGPLKDSITSGNLSIQDWLNFGGDEPLTDKSANPYLELLAKQQGGPTGLADFDPSLAASKRQGMMPLLGQQAAMMSSSAPPSADYEQTLFGKAAQKDYDRLGSIDPKVTDQIYSNELGMTTGNAEQNRMLAQGIGGAGQGLGKLISALTPPEPERETSPLPQFQVGGLIGGGGGPAQAAMALSDPSQKKNISTRDALIKDYLDKIRPVQFNYKDPEKYGAGRRTGVLSEDVAASKLGSAMTVKDPETGHDFLNMDPRLKGPLDMAVQSHLNQRLNNIEQLLGNIGKAGEAVKSTMKVPESLKRFAKRASESSLRMLPILPPSESDYIHAGGFPLNQLKIPLYPSREMPRSTGPYPGFDEGGGTEPRPERRAPANEIDQRALARLFAGVD